MGAAPALVERGVVIWPTSGHSIAPYALSGLAHQVAEGRQRHELARGEERAVLRDPIVLYTKAKRSLREVRVRLPRWLGLNRNRLMPRARGQICLLYTSDAADE